MLLKPTNFPFSFLIGIIYYPLCTWGLISVIFFLFIDKNNDVTISSIGKNFDISGSEAKMHLGFLKEASIIEKIEHDPSVYSLTTRGEKYLENVEEVL
ncbi:hypothetical protein AKJ65_04905 [candidate division MSBL1 archaeon SCGC-AAA259E19]|uniref:ArnR1-like winged helix-turn-helix domain-containing protein n=1 Tax=candidate division MSBL1 archaeon SCGC-AAA259E19 TaxID=1698264 RepID=A0A133UJ66_9EURY|nr:hypothetical protein AKJ65_04905 [candidate division MSBL1 archaeon SCGC-AAA259E19]